MYFVASTRHRLGFKTIKVYLAAIQYRSATLGWPLIIASMIRLHYALRGIRRLQGPEFTRPLRSPITTHHLRILRHHFMNYVSQRSDGYMLTTAALLAFFGLLRASEYLSESSNHFDKLCNLQCCHISFAPDLTYMKINIPQSKTDPFRAGQQVTLWKTGNDLCPVKAAWNFIPHHPTGTGPFFTYANGTFLTRRRWSDIIQSIIPEVNINTHSFRIGGASAAAAAGIPDSTIQILGRWSSEAYKLYLRLPESTFCEASSKMARMKKCTITYSPKRE